MHWQDGSQIERALEAVFNDILYTRMRDVAVVNPVLSVRAVGFDLIDEDWLGVLITPWFMNLLLLPGSDGHWISLSAGSKFDLHLPFGRFEFTRADEGQLGCYALCSLFSPMFEFQDQDAAIAAARAVLAHLFEPDPAKAALPLPTISRRDLLRGSFSRQDQRS